MKEKKQNEYGILTVYTMPYESIDQRNSIPHICKAWFQVLLAPAVPWLLAPAVGMAVGMAANTAVGVAVA